MSSKARTVPIAIAIAVLAGCSSSPRGPVLPEGGSNRTAGLGAEAIERGRLLTATACAGCHSTAATGASPMADATPFREILHDYPMDQLEGAFAEGLVTTHPAMPPYIFRAGEIDDLVAYLETLKAEP
jgi:mono/diheme cytochrome c family protein